MSSLDNPDFRAEGSFNKNHIRGYGLRGRRVFDFGWQSAERGWGKGGVSRMRLQMHATDPGVLEPRLGRVASEGCISIPATLNVFLDRYGVLDADYEEAIAAGKAQWVIRPAPPARPSPGLAGTACADERSQMANGVNMRPCPAVHFHIRETRP